MKTLTTLLALAIVPLIGCVQPDEKPGTPFCDENCEAPENNTPNNNTPIDLPELKGAFISGHLGTYWDCPGEAYMGPDAEADLAPTSDGACAEGSECPIFSSCETAQITISLSNGGDITALGIAVGEVELFGTDGVSRAELPILALIDTSTNLEFDGTLEAGEDVIVRVEFQGPYNPWELLQPADGTADGDRAAGGGGIVHTTFSSDNHAELTVVSGEIYDVPAIDT